MAIFTIYYILYTFLKSQYNNSKNIFGLSKNKQYYVLIQTNFLTFRSWAIVSIEIQKHKEKKIIDEKYFSPPFIFLSTLSKYLFLCVI